MEPDVAKIRSVDLLIDEPGVHAQKFLDKVNSDRKVLECVKNRFDDLTIVSMLPTFSHDMRTQRFSPKRTEWSREMISVLRRLVGCVYGDPYGLLADLHVILDMAQKWCCDNKLLGDWARDVGISPEVLEFYRRNVAMIDKDLKCSERLRKGECGRRNVAEFVREEKS